MTDLYVELGVTRDPPPTTLQIRQSYRRRVKRAHPDGGGSVEEFQRVIQAMSVLTDPHRRRVYDETGRIEDAPIDDLDNRALQFLFGQIEFVIGRIMAHGRSLDEIDVIGDTRHGLNAKLQQIDAQKHQIEQQRDVAEKVAAKFKARRGKNDRIGPMYRAKAAQLAQNLAAHDRDSEMVKRAIEILGEHEYQWSAPPQFRVMNGMFFTVGGT